MYLHLNACSHKVGDYNSCDLELSEAHCLKCDSDNVIECYYACSHKVGDYNSCDLELSEAPCLKCDSDKHRVLFSTPPPSKCMCEIGWFDPTVE